MPTMYIPEGYLGAEPSGQCEWHGLLDKGGVKRVVGRAGFKDEGGTRMPDASGTIDGL